MDYFDEEYSPTLDAYGNPLTDIQLDEKLLCEDHLLEFVQSGWRYVVDQSLIVEPHIELQCRHLEAVSRSPRYSPRRDPNNSISRLLINVPPSVGKSTILSVLWPAWVWTWWPSARFLFFSYSEKIIKRDSALCRQLFRSDWYQRYWGKHCAPGDKDQILDFNTNSKGWRLSLLVGAGTGHHPDFTCVDDAQGRDGSKNPNERAKVKHWFFETLPTRGRTRKAAIVNQQQRFDEEDLSGEIKTFIASNADKRVGMAWHCMNLPMHYAPERAMVDRGFGADWRTEAGELLCPKLLSVEDIEDLVIEVTQTDPGGADAQLEQNPTKYTGDIFRIDRLVRISKAEAQGVKFERIVRFWDRASTQGGGCNTAGVKMGRRGQDLFILHCDAGQWSVANVYAKMRANALLDELEHGIENFEIEIEREGGSGGTEAAENAVLELPGYRVKVIPPWTNKAARAQPLANRIAVTTVYIVEDEWTASFLDEYRKFGPGATKVDRVDAGSGAYRSLFGSGVPKKPRAIMAGLTAQAICIGKDCKRPAAKDSEFCCTCCEQVAAFNDPEMEVEHDVACIQRSFDHQQSR